MQIDWIYRDAVPVGTSATSLLLMSKEPPPPPRHPIIHHFGHAGLCRAHIKHRDQLWLSSYQLESTGLCRAQDLMGCRLIGSTEALYQLELKQLHCC